MSIYGFTLPSLKINSFNFLVFFSKSRSSLLLASAISALEVWHKINLVSSFWSFVDYIKSSTFVILFSQCSQGTWCFTHCYLESYWSFSFTYPSHSLQTSLSSHVRACRWLFLRHLHLKLQVKWDLFIRWWDWIIDSFPCYECHPRRK